MIKAFISHSSAQKAFATELVEAIGRNFCMIDCYDFESAYKSIDEIYRCIEESSIFVLLISRESLDSDWVQKEIRKAKTQMSQQQLSRFWPFIIDKSVNLDDIPGWIVRGESYNLKYFESPKILARDIEQKFRKIIWDNNPGIRVRDTAFAGRNEDISLFENKLYSANGKRLRSLIVSGREGVGKESFVKQCLCKLDYPKEIEPYRIGMQQKEGVEDFIALLNLITRTYNSEDIKDILSRGPQEKAEVAVELLNTLYSTRSVVLVDDNMSCVLPTKDLPEWLSDILSNPKLNSQLGLFILSKIAPNAYVESSIPQVAHIPLKPLNKNDRKKLFYLIANSYGLNVKDEDANFFVEKLLQSPEQIYKAVESIKTNGLIRAKADISSLISLGDRKTKAILQSFSDEEREVVITLARFEFLSFDILEDFFEERYKEAYDTVTDLIAYGVASAFGPYDDFVRMDASVSDYIMRNNMSLPKDLEYHIKSVLEKRMAESNDITEDISLYLYETKTKIMSGKSVADDYMMPSVVIRAIIDLYNQERYPEVIPICDTVLNDNHFKYYNEAKREITYWLCLALCRTQDEDRFKVEVQKIDGSDYDFLCGFFNRIAKRYPAAEKAFKKALQKSPHSQKAKREMVTVLMKLKNYPEALSLAEDNYNNDPDNPYHIKAYFKCLVRKYGLNRADIDVLESLIDSMKSNYSTKKDAIVTAMNIEFQSYARHANPTKMLQIISEAEEAFPHSNDVKSAANEYRYRQEMITKEVDLDDD